MASSLLLRRFSIGWQSFAYLDQLGRYRPGGLDMMIERVPPSRSMSKKGRQKGGQKSRGDFDESLMDGLVNVEALKKSMQTAVDALEWQFSKGLTTRPTVGLLDHVHVKLPNGSEKRLRDVAQLSQRADNAFIINFPGQPELSQLIISAISTCGLGLDAVPSTKTQLRVPLPKLTKEFRLKIGHLAKEAANKAKIGIRRVRNQAVSDLKKQDKTGRVSTDDIYTCEQQIQMMTDTHNKKIDELLATKNKELFPK